MFKGSIINVALIVLGGIIGLLMQKGIPEKLKNTVMQGMGLAVVLIGLQMAIGSKQAVIVILSLAIGAVLGEIIDIEAKLEQIGKYFENKFPNKGEQSFSRGFVVTSLIYCVGAMAIMGALNSGLQGDHSVLIAKGLIDGVTAIVFASTLGIGVIFSAIPVFVYQGSITLLAGWLNQFLNTAIITEMSAVGGLLIAAIGLNLLNICKIKIGNLLPAVFLPIFLLHLVQLL